MSVQLQIRVRRDSSTAWAIVNPILASGEIGYENDTKRMKVGDGVTAYNSLSYLSGATHTHASADIVSGTLDIARIPTGTSSTTVALGNHNHAISTLTGVSISAPTAGQVLKYDGTNWKNDTDSTGGGGAPVGVDYLVRTADATLTAERVVADSSSVTADWGTAGQVQFQRAALTGDVTASANSNATTIAASAVTTAKIADDAVTYDKLQNVSTTDRILGRVSAGAGNIEEIACTSAGRALIDDADAAAQRATLGLGSLATQSGTFSGTSSGTNTGDQNIFSTVSVAGQSNVVADSTADTLTLVAGSNVTITTDAATDTITISATGGGGGAPTSADYLVRTADATLTAERVVTDSTSVTANWGTAGQVAFERAALTGDVTASANSNATTIANNAVTFAKMQNSAAAGLSVVGRSTNTAGAFAEINAATNGHVLRRSGTSIGFGTIGADGVAMNALTLDKLVQSGAGLSVVGCPVNTVDNFSEIVATTDNTVLRRSGNNVTFGTVATGGIADAAITYAKIQNVATNRLLGRATAGSGVVEEITIGSGLSLTGTTLSSTGGGGVTDGDKGDITVSGTGATWTIDSGAVTYAKIQNVGTARILGRASAGSGVVEEITIGSGLALTGTVLDATASASVPDFVYIQMGIV